MAQYWGRFVPSVSNGSPQGPWEKFRNAENPARTLKARARDQYGRVYYADLDTRGPRPLVAFNEADQSAIMLMWLSREEPAPDKAPDEVWQLTNHYALIRTPWSAIIEPATEFADPDPDDDEQTWVREPSLASHGENEAAFINLVDEVAPALIWQPPNLDELAERKVILQGDKRPLTAGAYSERQVEMPNLRRVCPDCGVVPSPFTLECKC